MDMDKTASSLDTTDNPGADIQRLASASSFHTVAPKTATWIVVVIFRTQQQREMTLQDFIGFMKRSKWKLCQSHKREAIVRNYLSVIDMGMWRARHAHVIGPCGGHDMQRPTSWNDGQQLWKGNVGQPGRVQVQEATQWPNEHTSKHIR